VYLLIGCLSESDETKMNRIPLPVLIRNNFTSMSEEYEAFAREKDGCRTCSLYEHYHQVVQSEGNAENPTFMIIGEAPGADEAEKGRPFIGKAGQRLRKSLYRHKDVFNKKTTLISNVVACRPEANKFPKTEEPQACYEMWLKREIGIVQPEILILLGNQSLSYVRGETGITRLRGQWEWIDELSVTSFATYHPSYVMRCENGMNKEVGTQFEADIDTLAEEGRKILQV